MKRFPDPVIEKIDGINVVRDDLIECGSKRRVIDRLLKGGKEFVYASTAYGRAQVFIAPEKFDRDAKIKPPFPSCSNYDAKAWRFIREHARPGALFWNVAK